MKKTVITIFFLFVAVISNAQSFDIVKANKYFDRAFYTEAIPLFENILEDKFRSIVDQISVLGYQATTAVVPALPGIERFATKFRTRVRIGVLDQ